MIVTTTETVPGHEITRIIDVVCARGDSKKWFPNYEDRIAEAKLELAERAKALGADAVVGVSLSNNENFEIVILIGTAVKLARL